jgi:hypothetical protein
MELDKEEGKKERQQRTKDRAMTIKLQGIHNQQATKNTVKNGQKPCPLLA